VPAQSAKSQTESQIPSRKARCSPPSPGARGGPTSTVDLRGIAPNVSYAPIMTAIHERIPGSMFEQLPGTPHMQTLEQPDLVAAALDPFYRANDFPEVHSSSLTEARAVIQPAGVNAVISDPQGAAFAVFEGETDHERRTDQARTIGRKKLTG
jgi:hypothetical protein